MPVPSLKAESKPGNWITLTVMINYMINISKPEST